MSEIPLVRVADCCDILDNERIPLNSEQRSKIKGNIPYYGANGVQGFINKYLFDEELILLAEDGGNFEEYETRPIAYRVRGKSWVNNHAHVLRVKREYDKSFVFYSLEHKNVTHFIKGGTRAKLNQAELREITIWDASYETQKQIGELFNKLNAQIDTTQALIDKYTLIKQGMMADLFSRGIDTSTGQLRPSFEEAPEHYHKTDLGWLPKGWDALPLSELSTIASGITMGKDLTGVKTVTVPYLRVANVQDGYLDLSEVKTVKVPADEAGKYVLQYGDVLMNEGGDFDKLGRGTVWRNEINECSHQNHVFRVRVQESKLRSEYLAYWSASSFGKKYFILNSKQSTNLASINSTQLKAFPIATPSSTEQLEIETRVKSVDNMISAYQSELNKLTLQKQGLMQDLLTGKVSIK